MAKVLEDIKRRLQTPFTNAPFTDFSKEENKRAQEEAITQVRSELGQTYPLIIGGKKITGEKTFASVNPSAASFSARRNSTLTAGFLSGSAAALTAFPSRHSTTTNTTAAGKRPR